MSHKTWQLRDELKVVVNLWNNVCLSIFFYVIVFEANSPCSGISKKWSAIFVGRILPKILRVSFKIQRILENQNWGNLEELSAKDQRRPSQLSCFVGQGVRTHIIVCVSVSINSRNLEKISFYILRYLKMKSWNKEIIQTNVE